MAAGDPGPGWLYMAQADGSGVRRLTPALMADIRTYSVAPDGGEVLVVGIPAATAGSQMAPVMSIVRADGSAMRTVDAGMAVLDAAYRPPDGSRIVFLGVGWYGAPPQREGIYEMNADGTGVRAIVAPSPTSSVGDWSLSPDGARLAYTRSDPASDGTDRQHVVNLDGTADQNVELDPSSAWGNGIWSNDGTRLLVFGLAKNGQDGPFQAVIASPDAGQGRPVQLVVPSGAAQGYDQVEWAPDDRSILVTLRDAADEPLRQVLWDPASGTFRAVAWETTSAPTWQRLAP
jgi:dipeptidyl aminopeptidase/acylaminoacyl peptidase